MRRQDTSPSWSSPTSSSTWLPWWWWWWSAGADKRQSYQSRASQQTAGCAHCSSSSSSSSLSSSLSSPSESSSPQYSKWDRNCCSVSVWNKIVSKHLVLLFCCMVIIFASLTWECHILLKQWRLVFAEIYADIFSFWPFAGLDLCPIVQPRLIMMMRLLCSWQSKLAIDSFKFKLVIPILNKSLCLRILARATCVIMHWARSVKCCPK